MVERLRADGMRDERVLAALGAVPRHRFVDTALATQAYEDTSLPIGLGQTISKPSVVARMLELLLAAQAARRRARLGACWRSAPAAATRPRCCALLARSVVSIERLKPLHDKARENLAALRPSTLRLVFGDGTPRPCAERALRQHHRRRRRRRSPDCLAGSAGGGRAAGRTDAPTPARRSGAGGVRPAPRTACCSRVHEAVHFVPLKSGTA